MKLRKLLQLLFGYLEINMDVFFSFSNVLYGNFHKKSIIKIERYPNHIKYAWK